MPVLEASLTDEIMDWTPDEYHLSNRKRRIDIWIKGGVGEVTFMDARIRVPWNWRRRLRWAVDYCIAARAVEEFKRR